jgi:DNA repair photolyase
VLLRLPLAVKDLFQDWLRTAYPDRAGKVLAQVRAMRGGRDYDPSWGQRQRGQGPYAQMIAQRFAAACGRLGLNQARAVLDPSQFRRPHSHDVAGGGQMALFGDDETA